MARNYCALTVYFEDPFWVGLYERQEEAGYQVCKTTFGAEPRDNEVYEWLLARWGELVFTPFLPENAPKITKMNPKRERRKARKSLSGLPEGTKAQQAIKLWQEQKKTDQHQKYQAFQEKAAAEKFHLRQEKKRQKHRGR